MILEVIATHLSDVIDAEKYGADRLELSPGMLEDGITPSFGLIEAAVRNAKIPINVMIRPHSKSFVYDENDIETMIKDIQIAKKLGANGIVFGALTKDGQIDKEVVKRLLAEAEGLDVTFHRAFDYSRNLEEAFECLAEFNQIKRILTAGGKNKATMNIEPLKKLIQLLKQTHIKIMTGYGLRVESLSYFVREVKPEEVHFGSGVRIQNSYKYPIDPDKMKKIKDIFVKNV